MLNGRLQVGSANGYSNGPTGPAPNEPTMLGRANELLNHLANAEHHSDSLRGALFGEGESGGPARTMPTSLEGMLAEACTRVASLCGDLATIKSRLGCSPE